MERLLLAFLLIGTTLACSPVPEPKVKGKGHDIVYVTLVTNQTYNPAGISTFLSDFSKTEIQQYSASVGDFSDLNCTNTDGYFTWTFELTDANCSIVEAWVKQIVASSSFYKNGYASCGDTAYVTLVVNADYESAAIDVMSIMNQSQSPADIAYNGYLSDISQTEAEGHLAYTFTYTNANCSNVEHSVALLVDGASAGEDFVNGTVTCVHAGNRTPWVVSPPPWATTTTNDNLIEITSPPTTTTTATPLVTYPGGALPAAPVFIPYQSDYEETAEHVEESVSSFESMSIMGL
uniref:Ig-like domain-containing protein n=1 Tax=Haemonchus contortus TaxID=6289 RepID=A0A7I4YEW9_HAECO